VEKQQWKPGDFVFYNFNSGHGARQTTGRINEIVSSHFVKIDDNTVPVQSIVQKIEVKESEFLDFKTILKAAQEGEKGSARLFARLMDGQAIYDHTDSSWYFWNETYWERDQTQRIMNTVTDQLSSQYAHALSTAYKKYDRDNWRVKLLNKVINSLNYKSGINNVLALAQAQQELSITSDQWGKNPWLLGCLNGVLDLREGETRPGEPEDYIRDIAPSLWQGDDCPCPRFEQFLDEIFNGNMEKKYFLQRLIGYSLIGLQVDHVLPILCGADGRNGKTVLLNILRHVFGPYMTPASEEILLSGKKNPGAATPFLVMLQNKRLVYITETDEGDRLDAGTVKQLTGNDTIIARNLYGSPFTFEPSHTVFLITNHTPHANSDDAALWERVVLIEFDQRFIDEPTEENEHKRDPYLMQELENESSGILAWAVRGCLRWQRQGLLIPQCVKIATETYRQGEDSLGKFLEENCSEGDFSVLAKEFYASYKEWSGENGQKAMSSTAFGKRMSKRFEKGRQAGTGKTVYQGVKLAAEAIKIELNI
jgi:putative DNA primase/helicase